MFDRLLNGKRDTSLGRKIALIFVVIISISTLVTSILLNAIATNQASRQIARQSNLFMDCMLAVREYTSQNVNQIISPLNREGVEFRPEAVPSYSATTVFAYLKQKPQYREYSYREATLNPTNLKDKADAVETAIIEAFRTDPSLQIKSGNRTSLLGDFHYIARPIKITKQSCLSCHSTPAKAPRSQLLTYGSNNGFGWKMGEVVGAQIVTVPISGINQEKKGLLLWNSLLLALSFFAIAITSAFALHKLVIQPLRKITAMADEASVNPEAVDFTGRSRSDEIGRLARSFERMRQSLMISMNMLKKREP
jgi:HAMP domain-containing protein